jgi:hypothetical protein
MKPDTMQHRLYVIVCAETIKDGRSDVVSGDVSDELTEIPGYAANRLNAEDFVVIKYIQTARGRAD